MAKKLLLVDDETNHRLMLKLHLEDAGYVCDEAENGAQALMAIDERLYDGILLDVKMDVMDGMTFLSHIRSSGNETPVVMITAFSDVKTAVSAMKLGATDFLAKPVNIDELLRVVNTLIVDTPDTESHIMSDYTFGGVYSKSGLGSVIDLLKMVAPTDATVLILGESGTGKELIARSIHDNSNRASGPFVAVNCAALNENLIESELFGHMKGAFTGASANREGRFEHAQNGTIFLDEIGEVPLATQAKLLRVLQEKVFEPVGSTKSKTTNARIIAATNRDLETVSAQGEFRQDLYFRLSVFPVKIPPLRERQEELPLLVKFFIEKYAAGFGKNIKGASPAFLKKLEQYGFPGNIRELENIVERSIILSRSEILEPELLIGLDTSAPVVSESLNLKDGEKQRIIDALDRADGNRTKAAKMLGISRRALYYKIDEYGIEKAEG